MLFVSQLTKPIQMHGRQNSPGVKEAFDATTTFYDWAAGVESNNDITPVLQENTQKLASGKLDAAGFIKAMKEAAGK